MDPYKILFIGIPLSVLHYTRIAFCSLFFLCLTLSGNTQTNKIVLKSYVQNGEVYLKWAPVDKTTFELGLKNGYEIRTLDVAGNKVMKTIKAPFTLFDSLQTNKLPLPQAFILISALKTNKADEKIKKQAFAMALIHSSHNKESSLAYGLIYQFRSTANLTYQINIKGTTVSSNSVSVDPLQETTSKAILLNKAIIEKKSVTLEWESQNLTSDYAAYWPERSEDNITFTRVSKSPVVFFKSQYEKNKVNCYFTDTSCVQGKKYFYRLQGINHVCLETNKSNVIEAYLKKSFNIAVYIDTITAVKHQKSIKVRLETSNKEDLKNIDNYFLQTSVQPAKGFKTILKNPINTQTTFTFTDTVQRKKTHYRAGIISTDGDTVYSYPYYFFMRDDIPPAQPQQVKGSIDEKGIVTLNWLKSTEKDLLGYKVFWCNNTGEEFVEKTKKLVNGVYIDTISLDNLDSMIYYQVVAVDSVFNHSIPSLPIRLRKPDKIAPVGVVITQLTQTKKGLLLDWNKSSSTDVKNTTIFRLEYNTPTIVLQLLPKDTLSYLHDTSIVPGHTYKYEIQVIDYSGNKTLVTSPQQKFEPGIRKAVEQLKAIVKIDKKLVELSWYPFNEPVYRYSIYRSKNNGSFTLVKTLDGSQKTFTDTDVNINNTYSYKITAILQSGIKTEMSKVVVVQY